jgi:hypothetical protein
MMVKAIGSPGLALILVVTGLLTALLSTHTWATCPTTPCGGALMAISEYSGLDLGFGAVTALAGLVLAAIGLDAFRTRRAPRFATAAALLSMLIVVTAGASIIWMYILSGDDNHFSEPPWVAFLVGILGLIALAASASLRMDQPRKTG